MNISNALLVFPVTAILAIAQPAAAPKAAYSPVAGVGAPIKAAPAVHSGVSGTGWGSVANPGHPPGVPASVPYNSVPYNNYNTGTGKSRSKYRTPYIAIGYPVYLPTGYTEQGPPVEQQPIESDRRPVIIQNFYANPQQPAESQLQTYVAPSTSPVIETPAQTAVNNGNYYLIAYKDHHVYSALAYWIEGATFHFVTTQNVHNQLSMDGLDLNLTKRLNQDRNMAFTATQQ